MVELIGLVTVVALSWVLASSMANESDAEKRRCMKATGLSARNEDSRTVFVTKDAA